MDVARRIDAVHAVTDHIAHRMVQFGGELGAGGTGADDGDVQLSGARPFGLGVGAQTGIDDPAVEAAGLLRGFQRHRELRRARRAEIIGDAADRHDQRVIGHRGRRRDLPALFIEHLGQFQLLGFAVDADHLAIAIDKIVPMRLRQIVQLVLRAAQAAGRHRVQQRLPQMGARTLDQRHGGAP